MVDLGCLSLPPLSPSNLPRTQVTLICFSCHLLKVSRKQITHFLIMPCGVVLANQKVLLKGTVQLCVVRGFFSVLQSEVAKVDLRQCGVGQHALSYNAPVFMHEKNKIALTFRNCLVFADQ